MDNATTLGFQKDPKLVNKMQFKNSIQKIYMKNQDCGNLEIPEVHPIVSFKGGQKHMHENSVDAICANPQTDTQFATGSHDHTIKIWDAPKYAVKGTIKGHEKGVWALSYDPAGTRLISASPDHTARIWDIKSGKQTNLLNAHTHFCFKAAFSPDGLKAASVGADFKMHYWDLRNTQSPVYTNSDFNKVLMAVDFMPEGNQVLVTSIEGEIGVINVETPGQEERQYYHDTMPAIRDADKENRRIFEEQREQMESLKVKEPQEPQTNIIYCVKAIPFDYGVFLYGAADSNVTKCRIGNFFTEQVDLFSGHSSGVRSIDFSRDHKYLITGCEDHSLRVWDYASGEAKLLLSGHKDVVSGGSFLNHDTIVSSSWDMTVKIWKI